MLMCSLILLRHASACSSCLREKYGRIRSTVSCIFFFLSSKADQCNATVMLCLWSFTEKNRKFPIVTNMSDESHTVKITNPDTKKHTPMRWYFNNRRSDGSNHHAHTPLLPPRTAVMLLLLQLLLDEVILRVRCSSVARKTWLNSFPPLTELQKSLSLVVKGIPTQESGKRGK